MTKVNLNSQSFWRRGVVLLLCAVFALSLVPNSASAYYRDSRKPSLNTIEVDESPWGSDQNTPTIIENTRTVRMSSWEKFGMITKLYFRVMYGSMQPKKDVNVSPIPIGSGASTTASPASSTRQGE